MFEKILINSTTLNHVKWFIEGNRATCPSLVLLGEKGIGKSLIAKEIAKWFLELPVGAPPQVSLDYYEVSPERDSSLKEQVEELMAFASYAPNQAKRRVILINEAELINQGTLLKLLEDQAKTCVFLMVASRDLLPTIYSRSIVFTVSPPSRKELKDFLSAQNRTVDNLLLLVSGGRLGYYEKFQGKEEYQNAIKKFLNVFNHMEQKREILAACGALKEKDPDFFYTAFSQDEIMGFFHMLEAIFQQNLASFSGISQELPIPIRTDLPQIYDRETTAGLLFSLERDKQRLRRNGGYSKNDFFDLLIKLVE